MGTTLADQVGQAASLLGLLLALDTLFTSEQARRLADEREREGGARHRQVQIIRLVSVGLAAVTTASIACLVPLARDVIDAIGTDEWQPVFGVFLLTNLLLVALLAWQIAIAIRAH